MSNTAFYPAVPHAPAQWSREWGERISYGLNTCIQNGNCTNDFTLTPSVTSTIMTDTRIHPDAVISFMAVTANAATAKPSIWVSDVGKGTATIHHASSANTDQTFRVSIVG